MLHHRALILFSCAVLLTGCSVFSAVPSQTTNKYVINTVNETQYPRHARNTVLMVNTPQIAGVYNTSEMAYVIHPYEISYFSKNAWADTPTHMLTPLMMQSLENTQAFKGIVNATFSGNVDYVLNTQIISLQQSFLTNPSEIQLVVRANILKNSSQKIVASKTFSITERTTANTPYGGVVAANRAVMQFMQELAEFCVKAT